MDDRFDTLIWKAYRTYGVPFQWIKAIIATESSFNPNAYRAEPRINDASYGLMQILETTARKIGFTGGRTELYDPETNIMLGTKLLATDIIPRCGLNFERVYSAYNSGGCDRYQESSQVAEHVKRAVDWLRSAEEDVKKKLRLG